MTINSIEELNETFYDNDAQRKFHMYRAKSFYNDIVSTLGIDPVTILALSRSWLSEYLISIGKSVKFPFQISKHDRFDLIIAVDEVLTRDTDEDSQKKHITQIVGLLNPEGCLLASLRDYRNSNWHKRPLGDTAYNMIDGHTMVTVEVNDPDQRDKQAWEQKMNIIVNDNELTTLNLGARRTLYFKQLAKYCADAGADVFGVLKELHWKNHFRRTPEHVVYAKASK